MAPAPRSPERAAAGSYSVVGSGPMLQVPRDHVPGGDAPQIVAEARSLNGLRRSPLGQGRRRLWAQTGP